MTSLEAFELKEVKRRLTAGGDSNSHDSAHENDIALARLLILLHTNSSQGPMSCPNYIGRGATLTTKDENTVTRVCNHLHFKSIK